MSERYDPAPLAGSHDLRLPAWGPYSKRYIGISHIPDLASGIRFDLSVFPALYRRGVTPPNVNFESGYHPWEAASDLSFYRHRFDLVWKDQVYADIDFCKIDDQASLIRCELVNKTDDVLDLALHYMAFMNFPRCKGFSLRKGAVFARNEAIRPSRAILPKGVLWIPALAYQSIYFNRFDPAANLVYDGLLRGEIQDHGFVDGFGLGDGFGRCAGDTVCYDVEIPAPIHKATLILRFRMPEGGVTRFALSGSFQGDITLSGSMDFSMLPVRMGDLQPSLIRLEITSNGGAPVDFSGFVVAAEELADQVRFEPISWNYAPCIFPGPSEHSCLLKYDHVRPWYGLAWPTEHATVRELVSDNLDIWLRFMVHNHRLTVLQDPDAGEGHFTNVFVRPIIVEANSSRELFGLVCCGERECVEQRLADFEPNSPQCRLGYKKSRDLRFRFETTPAGEKYLFSQERMAATMLTNVVYPIRVRGQRVRHYTPGRWWDSVYTWDSGFIGLGLLELDIERAIDSLNAYLTEPGDPTAAFIHHGSPLPVQHYLFQELWNRTQSRELLEYFYPRLQQYHRFLAGRVGSSTTRNLQSNLIRTWDYFYNSGGWDDYPPQYHVYINQLFQTVAPVANTAHIIRTARILRAAARELGENSSEYEEDIALLTHALQEYSWDEASGYFSYVVHDESGHPSRILKTEEGVNFNMGLDGAYPLCAGACTPEQEARLAEVVMTPGRIWSQAGLSAVDQSAPYYRIDGYWNGSVWMPHQWFFWKTMLDLGRVDDAHRIAVTALNIWKKEVERSYNCYEHFPIRTSQGAGWHHFGGLSSPVLIWFGAYHRPGRLSVGLDIWAERLNLDRDSKGLTARLRHLGPSHRTPSVIAALAPGHAYRALWDGEEVPSYERYPGVIEVCLPTLNDAGDLEIKAQSSSLGYSSS